MVPRTRDYSDTPSPLPQPGPWPTSGRKRAVLLALASLLLIAMVVEALPLTFSAQRPLLAADRQERSGTTWQGLTLDNDLPAQAVRLASGVTEMNEQLLTLSGTQQISLLDINLARSQLHLGVVQAHDHLFSRGETLSSMASRSGAIAGINSDFFEIHQTNDPIGMLTINGQLWQSPGSYDVLGVTVSGRFTMGPESFSGSVTSGHESYALSSVNRYGDTGANHLRLYTPALGAALPLNGATLAILQPVANSATTFTVVSIRARARTLPILHGQSALVGSDVAAFWMSTYLHVGGTVDISEKIKPDEHLVQAVGGGPIVLKDGVIYHDPQVPAPSAVDAHNPLTAVGLSWDGKHALFVVCNGRKSDSSQSPGFTYAEMAGYLQAHGAYQAMIFDSGGSSEMVARLPGQSSISVLNAPSAGKERLVANGLFVYSGAAQAGSMGARP